MVRTRNLNKVVVNSSQPVHDAIEQAQPATAALAAAKVAGDQSAFKAVRYIRLQGHDVVNRRSWDSLCARTRPAIDAARKRRIAASDNSGS